MKNALCRKERIKASELIKHELNGKVVRTLLDSNKGIWYIVIDIFDVAGCYDPDIFGDILIDASRGGIKMIAIEDYKEYRPCHARRLTVVDELGMIRLAEDERLNLTDEQKKFLVHDVVTATFNSIKQTE